jgi:RHS repeat-associated protein
VPQAVLGVSVARRDRGSVFHARKEVPYNLRFPGQYYQAETGLNQNWNRDYDPIVGRYVESDPIGLHGGTYSTYVYVGDGPMSRSDPMGLTWGDDWYMFWAWVFGTAPPNTLYGPNTNQSMDMMKSPGVAKAINYFNNKNAGKCPNELAPVTNYGYKFGLKGLWQAGLNSTQQFVGSYSVDIFPNANGTLDVHIYNTTSMTSFFYGIYPNAWNPANGWPMGNASQEYVGAMPASTGATGCGCGSQ